MLSKAFLHKVVMWMLKSKSILFLLKCWIPDQYHSNTENPEVSKRVTSSH